MSLNIYTWAHVSQSTNAVLLTVLVSRCEPKVSEEDLRPVLIAEDVQGFQVPMVDVVRVTMIYGIDDLEEGGLDSGAIAGVCEVVVDQVVKATSRAIIEEGRDVVAKFDVFVQCDDVWMVGEEVVEGALLFPTGRLEHDFQHKLASSSVAAGNAEDSAVGAMGEVLLDVKVVGDLSTQQSRFEIVDVRGDGHLCGHCCRAGCVVVERGEGVGVRRVSL